MHLKLLISSLMTNSLSNLLSLLDSIKKVFYKVSLINKQVKMLVLS